jgi:hypothetical protein
MPFAKLKAALARASIAARLVAIAEAFATFTSQECPIFFAAVAMIASDRHLL